MRTDMTFIERIRDDYDTFTFGNDSVLMAIALIIIMIGAIALETNRFRIIRFIGVLTTPITAVFFGPILLPLVLLGICEAVWREV